MPARAGPVPSPRGGRWRSRAPVRGPQGGREHRARGSNSQGRGRRGRMHRTGRGDPLPLGSPRTLGREPPGMPRGPRPRSQRQVGRKSASAVPPRWLSRPSVARRPRARSRMRILLRIAIPRSRPGGRRVRRGTSVASPGARRVRRAPRSRKRPWPWDRARCSSPGLMSVRSGRTGALRSPCRGSRTPRRVRARSAGRPDSPAGVRPGPE